VFLSIPAQRYSVLFEIFKVAEMPSKPMDLSFNRLLSRTIRWFSALIGGPQRDQRQFAFGSRPGHTNALVRRLNGAYGVIVCFPKSSVVLKCLIDADLPNEYALSFP